MVHQVNVRCKVTGEMVDLVNYVNVWCTGLTMLLSGVRLLIKWLTTLVSGVRLLIKWLTTFSVQS